MSYLRSTTGLLLLCLLLPACAGVLTSGSWPSTSEHPVPGLEHRSLEGRAEELGPSVTGDHRMVAFGDQRALADGEWQRMIAAIVSRELELADAPPLVTVLDTGDAVDDGRHSDQFHMLAEILQPLRPWPYLMGVGNHEVHDNEGRRGRENLAKFLRPVVGEEITVDRLYYRKDVGLHRLLFLDTNDFVYGADGKAGEPYSLDARARAQMDWLVEQLAEPRPDQEWTTVLLHHPFVISSTKHEGHAVRLWSLRHEGRTLPEILLDGGVDLVLAGHTHTYERFEITRGDGASLQLVNVSGRPRGVFLGLGAGGRRARDISGRELEDLRRRGWTGLDGWQVEQHEAMIEHEANQWLELRYLESGRRVEGEVFFLRSGSAGARSGGVFSLRGPRSH